MTRAMPPLALLLGLLLLAAGWSAGPFADAYLAAVTAWTALSLGALTLLATNTLMGGKWGPRTARVLVPMVRTIPVAGLLFLPLLLTPDQVWPWARPGWQPDGPGKALWFDPGVFAARTIGYFVIWTVLGHWLPAPATLPRHLPRAVTTLAAQFLVGSLAGIDWLLSLDPDVNSSIFGLLFLTHQVAGAMAFATAVTLAWDETGGHTDRLGAILLATVIAWSYVAAMQFLVIWTTDLPHEALWYLRRTGGGWRWVAWGVVALHVVLPILALMWRKVRLVRGRLITAAGMVLAGFGLDSAWLVTPEGGLPATLLAFAGVGLVWLAAVGVFRARTPPHPQA